MLNHFKPSEFSHMTRMDAAFLHKVDAFRALHGFPTLITSDWRNSATSAHGEGLALDMVMYERYGETQPSAYTIWHMALHYAFKGVGIYFDWNAFGKPVVGLHVDDSRRNHRPLSWARISWRYYYFRHHNGMFIAKDGRSISPQDLFKL